MNAYSRGMTVREAYPVLSESVDPGYLRMPADDFEALLEGAGLDAEDLESFGRFMRSVGNVAARVAPVALPAVGTLIGGPVGGMIGGVAGNLAGQALAGATRPSPRAGARRPTAARTLRSAARGPAGQMMQVMSRPETSQAMLAQLLGGLGRQAVPVGGQQVPVQAFSQLLGQLGLQLAAEQAELQESLGYGEDVGGVPAEDLGPWLLSLFGSSTPALPRPRASAFEDEPEVDFDALFDAEDLDDIEDLALAGAW